MLATWVGGLGLDDPVEQLDFIDGGLGIVGSGAHHLQRNVLARGCVPRQPDSREVAPPKLAHHDVAAIIVRFAHGHRVIPTLAVVLGILLLGGGFNLVAR